MSTVLTGIGLILLVSIYVGAQGCLDGWTQHESSCYHFSHDMETWPDAAYVCKILGGKLVEIESAAENAYLTGKIDALKHEFWIGLTDLTEKNVWVWISDRVKLSSGGYSNWQPGEPNNSNGNENCVMMVHNAGGKWNDGMCHGLNYYICEQERFVILYQCDLV